MDKETIEKILKLEEKKRRWERFVKALEYNRAIGVYNRSGIILDSIYSVIDNKDDKEFIEHVLTCAKARLLQIDKEIEQL